MNRSVKKICITIVFVVCLQTIAKAQQTFIDSIRNMFIDLNEQVQFAPINQLLQRSIPLCTGDTMNDSLAADLKQLISDSCIFKKTLLLPVSPHLLKKYDLFLQRITLYFVQTETATMYKENMMRLALTKLNSPIKKLDPFFVHVRKMLLQIQFTDPFLHSKWLFYLGISYDNTYKPDSCYILYKQSLQENPNKTREENILYCTTLFWLAEFCRTQNKPDDVFPMLQQQLDLRKKIYGEKSSDYAFWLIQTANSYTYMAKYNLALSMDFKAMEIIRSTIGEETNHYALCLCEIGEVYYRMGEYDKALPFTQQALALKRKIFGNAYFDNVVNLHDLATLYTRMGLYNEAIPLLEESMSISKKYFGEDVVYAFDLHPLAVAYESLGDYDKAFPLYQQALSIQKKDGSKNVEYPRTLNSIACLYTKLGQYDKAIELFKQSLEIKKEVFHEMNPEYTTTLNDYAEAYLLKGDYKKALSLQLQSLQLNKKLFGETHPNIATGLYNLATLYYEQHNFQKAEDACNQSLRMRIKILGVRHPDIAISYDLLGSINMQMRHYNTALDYYQQAFEIRKNIMTATHPDYINSICNIGMVYLNKGRIHEAAQLFAEADSTALLHIEQSYATLSEEEKLIYLHTSEKQFQYLPSLLYLHKINSPEIANRIYRNALVLKSMVLFQQQKVYNSIRKSSDSAALQLYSHWRFYKAFLGQQILLPPSKRRSDFDSLQDVTTQLEEKLSRISASFKNNTLQHPSGAEEIAKHLSKNEAAVEFIRFRLYNSKWTDSIIYAALVLLPGKNDAVFIPLCEEKQLKKLLRFSNNNGEAAVNYLYPPAGKQTEVSNALFQLVWKPLQPVLTDVRTVYYSPSGLLCRLSFAAIHAGSDKLLTDKYNLKQFLCTRSLAWSSQNKDFFTTASLWGDIDYDNAATITAAPLTGYVSGGTVLFAPSYDFNATNKNNYNRVWQALPGTKTETEKIFLLLKEKNIIAEQQNGSAASEEQFKKMDGASPGLLHIATHGFFLQAAAASKASGYHPEESNSFSLQQNPMFRSGLLLAGSNATWSGNATQHTREDGVLTAYEISQLDLSNSQLITLSACETALGDIEDNEGVYGLQRAFKMAGAQRLLMSLWKVPDKETSELMLIFYTYLLQGDDASNALHNTQLAMKEKYAPYYWAGFVLTE